MITSLPQLISFLKRYYCFFFVSLSCFLTQTIKFKTKTNTKTKTKCNKMLRNLWKSATSALAQQQTVQIENQSVTTNESLPNSILSTTTSSPNQQSSDTEQKEGDDDLDSLSSYQQISTSLNGSHQSLIHNHSTIVRRLFSP